jgi:hypothetical protein
MAEEKKEPWMSLLALTTVILAVCATLSTFKGSSFSTRSVMSQTRAANQWSFFQAKSIKGYLYEIRKEELEMGLKELDSPGAVKVVNAYKAKIDAYQKKIERYDAEKVEIQKEARNQEAIRDDAQLHSRIFGMAVIFLQIAILLSSIAALLKRKSIWILGLLVGAVGLVYFMNGFLLFMK